MSISASPRYLTRHNATIWSGRYEIVTACPPLRRNFTLCVTVRLDGRTRSPKADQGGQERAVAQAAAELSLALLGPPVVTRNGTPVSFDTRKATAVLALLAVEGREFSRERLAVLLWPEADTTRARASLRRTLSVTAAAVGGGLKVTRTAVALEPSRVRVDVTEFQALAAISEAGPLDRAARIYRDDFLAGFALRGCPEFDDWQATTADRLRQDLAGALEQLVMACAAAGDLAHAVDHARRWLSLDPLHEPAHQALIRLQAWTGQRSAALRQYRSLVRILDSELAVRPLPETTRLYDDVRTDRLAPPVETARPASAPLVETARPASAPPVGAARPAGSAGAAIWPLVGRGAEPRTLHEIRRAAWR